MSAKVLITCQKDYIMAIKMENGEIIDFFALPYDDAVNNIYIGKVENVRNKQCFVRYDADRKNGILEIKKNASYKSGDYIRCQVKREEQGEKGAVLGAKITLPGRYAIFVEGIEGYKFSNKLDKRQRAEIMQKLPPPNGRGYIIKSAAMQADEAAIREEINCLNEKYEKINSVDCSRIKCIYKEDIFEKTIRELSASDLEIIADKKDINIKGADYYDGIKPLIDYYGLRGQILALFERKVKLKSGAELVIEETEAMTVIDVNAKACAYGNHFAINLEAAAEIIRQINLRNIGGFILIDFITHKKFKELYNQIKILLKNDKEKSQMKAIEEYSIIAINRKKRYNTFSALLYDKCGLCHAGKTEKKAYKCQKICEEILNIYAEKPFKNILATVSDTLYDEFIASAQFYLKRLPKKVKIYAETSACADYVLSVLDDKKESERGVLIGR